MRDTHALCVTSFAVERSRPRPRWIVVWLLARLCAPWLDRQLAARSVPWRSPALPVIRATASRLRSRAPVDARGVTRLRALLSDGAGPCSSRADPVALTVALETISQWLDVQD
jgi:hypothetical protein